MNNYHAILWWNTRELLCLTSLCVINSANQRMFAECVASSDMGCAIKFHKTVKTLPCSCYMKIKHSAARLVLYFSYSTCGNALTYTYVLLVTCSFNSLCLQIPIVLWFELSLVSEVHDLLYTRYAALQSVHIYIQLYCIAVACWHNSYPIDTFFMPKIKWYPSPMKTPKFCLLKDHIV